MTNPFNNITENNKQKLLKLLESKTRLFPKKTSIISKYKTKNIIGIIEEGSIRIIRNNFDGTTNTIEELYENSTFIISTNNDIDIITLEDSKIILIDYDYIIENINNEKSYFNQFIKNLFMIMNDKIKEKNERIEILSKKSTRNKLLKYFNTEFNKTKSKYIYLPFNFKDLAEYLSVNRAAMTREIKYLKEDGLIETKGKRITLLYK